MSRRQVAFEMDLEFGFELCMLNCRVTFRGKEEPLPRFEGRKTFLTPFGQKREWFILAIVEFTMGG